jgi:hypothetical protein
MISGSPEQAGFPGQQFRRVVGVVRHTEFPLDGHHAFDFLAYETTPDGPFVTANAQPAGYVVTQKGSTGPLWGPALEAKLRERGVVASPGEPASAAHAAPISESPEPAPAPAPTN